MQFLVVALVACCNISTAQVQHNRLYVERRGDDDTANNCQDAANPCTLSHALTQLSSPTLQTDEIFPGFVVATGLVTDTIAVRVTAAGSTTNLGASQALTLSANSFYLAAYERIAPETNVSGTLVIEGDVSIADGGVTLDEKLTLEVLSNRLTLDAGRGMSTLAGRVVLDSRTDDMTIELTGDCPDLDEVTVMGELTIEGSCSIDGEFPSDPTTLPYVWFIYGSTALPTFRADPGLAITSLKLLSGSITLDDRLALHVIPFAPASDSRAAPPSMEVAAGTSIKGSGYVQWAPNPSAFWTPSDQDVFAEPNRTCFVVNGAGRLQVRFYKTSRANVCLDMTELEEGGSNLEGNLWVREAKTLKGSFTNGSLARTQFWQLTELDGDLEILGSEHFVPTLFRSTPTQTGYDPCTLDKYLGVHLFKGTVITGSVAMRDVKTVVDPGECYSGLYLSGIANPADPGMATTEAKGTQVTTVKGSFYGDIQALNVDSAGAKVHMRNHNFYHNLALEGDLNTQYGTSAFEMLEPARVPGSRGLVIVGGTPMLLPVGRGMDYCDAAIGPAVGNMLILSGEGLQNIELPGEDGTHLNIDALQVDKPGSAVQLSGAAGLSVDLLEVEAGTVVTGTAADGGLLRLLELVLNHNAGSRGAAAVVKSPGQENVYLPDGQPTIVVYKGNASQVIGDELARNDDGKSVLTRLAIAKSGDAVVELTHPLIIDWLLDLVSGKLVLHRVDDDADTGWLPLESEDATLSFTSNAYFIDVNKGDIAYPEDPAMHGSMAALHESVVFTPTLRYVGSSDRTTGLIWPSWPTNIESVQRSPTFYDVQVRSFCTQGETAAHPVISLGPGYTTVWGNTDFNVYNGAFDIAGQELNLISARTDGVQSITIHRGGQLCDSGAGQSCARRKGAQLAPAPEATHFDKWAYEESLEGMQKEYSEEQQLPKPEKLEVVDTFEAEARRVQLARGTARRIPGMKAQNWDERLALAEEFQSSQEYKNLHLPEAGKADTEPGWVNLFSGLVSPAGNALGSHWLQVWFSNDDLEATIPQLYAASRRVYIHANDLTPESRPGAMDRISTLTMPRLIMRRGTGRFDGTLDRVHITGSVTVVEGRFEVTRPYSFLLDHRYTPNSNGIPRMEMIVDGVWVQVGGFIDLGCNILDVDGSFWLGGLRNEDGSLPGASAVFLVGDKGLLRANGELFHVGPEFSATVPNLFSLGLPICREQVGYTTPIPDDAPIGLHVAGEYRFLGAGGYSSALLPGTPDHLLGLRGMVTFAGDGEEPQVIVQAEKPDAQFGDVTIATTGEDPSPVFMTGNVKQNATGTLTMKRGQIATTDPAYTWTLRNHATETIPKGHYTPERSTGVVNGGSRESYIAGVNVVRLVTGGQATGGVVRRGYFFPTGFPNLDANASRDVDFFRPLTMQFPDDIVPIWAAVAMRLVPSGSLTWPEENVVVSDTGGTTLQLNNMSDAFWVVRFSEKPTHAPNIRVAVEGLPNVHRLTGLRLVQWDCDGTNPRLAGTYDLSSDPTDDASLMANDWINGVPNLSQEGVDFDTCNIIGIAADYNENPISLPAQESGFSRVQLINSVIGTSLVDVYVDDRKVADDWGFQQATAYVPVVAGSRTLAITDAQAADNTSPLFTTSLELGTREDYAVMLYGDELNLHVAVKEETRMVASDRNMVDFFLLHGAPEMGPVDIRLLDPRDNRTITMLLANNLDYGDVGYYVSLPAGRYNMEITTANNDRQLAVYRLDLDPYSGAALLLNLTGAGKSSAEGVTMMGINALGNTFFPQLVTDTEPVTELPAEFTLHGNYPNPFNPSTTIALDLPEKAEVTLQVIDLLGRQVLEVSAGEVDAGAGRTLLLNADRLASGTYLYRVIARSASGIKIESGRMVVVK